MGVWIKIILNLTAIQQRFKVELMICGVLIELVQTNIPSPIFFPNYSGVKAPTQNVNDICNI